MTTEEKAQTTQTTEVGSYFVANYPPFSFWKPDFVDEARHVLAHPPQDNTPVGLYLHIPFCRKRCKFCYFRVYTDKNRKQRQEYIDALVRELETYVELPILRGRSPRFIYFGGGTPSALDEEQFGQLGEALRELVVWDQVEEVTFECEPGTLTEKKVIAIKELGVTRLSLGVENFSDSVLEENGRAHLSGEIHDAYEWITRAGFAQVNIDLIAGMVGETEENWRDCVRRTIAMKPNSVTIYQMELPYNTTYARQMFEQQTGSPVASWDTKRAWVQYAFAELAKVGYQQSSAYTMVLPGEKSGFVYRDSLWRGADMIGTGVSSFSYVQGMHYQNNDRFEPYVASASRGELPIYRALKTTAEDRLIREMILQLKLGKIETGWFADKFGVDITARFADAYQNLQQQGLLRLENGSVVVTPEGMLRVDSLLPHFYRQQHQNARYT